MTDRELAEMGERLYTAIIETRLSPLEVAGLTAAFRTRTPWPELGPGIKVAFFRVAANAAPPASAAGDGASTGTAADDPGEAGPGHGEEGGDA
jgi:hypothetical protein